MLFIVAQIEPKQKDGQICPVQANDQQEAIHEAEQMLGFTLTQIGKTNTYSAPDGRKFRVFEEVLDGKEFAALVETVIGPKKANLSLLAQFTGSEEYFINPIGRMKYTEGVRFLAENADCFWLIDAIASYQPTLMKQETFRYLQFWTLTVNEDRSALLVCREDTDSEPAVRQVIEHTDFPLPKIDLWVEHGTLILPQEH